VLVGVLRGAVYFLADLSRAVQHPHRLDFVEYASYHGTRKGEGALVRQCSGTVEHADVLVVDEVADTGETLDTLRKALRTQNPGSIAACALLVKPGAEGASKPEFAGFHVGSEFLVGYGLDHDQQLRHLSHVAVLDD